MKLLLSGAAVLVALAAPAVAQDSGVYVGGQFGGNWVLNDSSDFDFGNDAGVERFGELGYEGGVMLGALAGYRVADNFALEVEATYRTNQVEFLSGVGGLAREENFGVYGVMANALYLAPLDDTTTLYVGVGGGFMAGEIEEIVVGVEGGVDVGIDPDVEGGFAYQLKAGFDYALDGGNAFGVGIAYMETDFEVDEAVFGALGVQGDEFEIDYGALTGFVTYKFGM